MSFSGLQISDKFSSHAFTINDQKNIKPLMLINDNTEMITYLRNNDRVDDANFLCYSHKLICLGISGSRKKDGLEKNILVFGNRHFN